MKNVQQFMYRLSVFGFFTAVFMFINNLTRPTPAGGGSCEV